MTPQRVSILYFYSFSCNPLWRLFNLQQIMKTSMDEFEFRQILDHFPVVRSRDYHADLDSLRQLTQPAQIEEVKDLQDARDAVDKTGAESSGKDDHEAFWGKLKLAAEQKVGAADADKFCKAFQKLYKKLVYQELTLDAATRFINSRTL